jgi:prophage regulatory protein
MKTVVQKPSSNSALPVTSSLDQEPELIRLHEVLRITTLSRTTWYDGVKAGKYPQAKRISVRRVAWDRREVLEAIQ